MRGQHAHSELTGITDNLKHYIKSTGLTISKNLISQNPVLLDKKKRDTIITNGANKTSELKKTVEAF